MQPLLGDRGGEHRPVGLGVDPGVQPVAHRRLAQIEVLGLAHFEIGGAGNRRARIDQVGGVELLGAVLALVAAGALVAAIGAGALDIAVRQEAAVGMGVDLRSVTSSISPASARRPAKCWVSAWFRPRRTARNGRRTAGTRPPRSFCTSCHLGAVVGDRLAGLGGGELGRGAVLVGRTDQQHLVPAQRACSGHRHRKAAASRRDCRDA